MVSKIITASTVVLSLSLMPVERAHADKAGAFAAGALIGGLVDNGVDVVSCGTNTDPTWLSIDRWHGAEWQCKLPKMYLPRKFHRDWNNSIVVRSKTVNSRWRNADEMPGKGELTKL